MVTSLLVRNFIYTILLLSLLMPFASYSKGVINWQTYHRPPGIIKTGPEQGEGFVQKVLDLIIERMPEYEHRMPLASIGRAISDMKAGKRVCHPALFITPERKKYMVFSNASMVNPSNRIIAKQGVLDGFLVDGNVDFEAVLKSDLFTFALVKERSYTESIDEIFTRFSNNDKVKLISNTDLSSIFQLIHLNRVDLSILYPFELEYFLQHTEIPKHSLVSFKINGVAPFNSGSIACPNNAWGRAVIKQVNVVLKQIKHTDEYRQAVTTWWRKEAETEEFSKYYRDVFLVR
ncbi:TIGR02285 family protein [Thalassotalea fusca]